MGNHGPGRAAFAAALLLAAPSYAQVGPPPDARAPIEALLGLRDRDPAPLTDETPRIPLTSQTPPANAEELRFILRSVEFAGGEIYTSEDLQYLYADRIGTEISVADVFRIAAQAQARYRDDGYLFNRVIVPAQRIEDGEVRLELIEAVLETVRIEAPEAPLGPVEALAERIIAPLRGIRNPTLDQIERVLLLLNDIPGVMRAAAVPKLGGSERGAVRLFINMERDDKEFIVFADNRQSPIVGRGLFGGVASFNSWSEAGDTTSISLFGSGDFDDPFPQDFTERHTAQIEHSRFLSADGLRFSARALYSETHPGGEVKDFDITGDQAELELRLTQAVLRSRALSAQVWAAFTAAELNGEVPPQPGTAGIITADDSLRVAELGLAATARDPWGATEMQIAYRAGLPFLGASEKGQPGLSRADGDGRFNLIRGEISRTLILPETDPVQFWVEASGQYADRALLSSEEFTLGGPTLSRAYDPSEYAGDIGYGISGEIRVPTSFEIYEERIDGTFYGFADLAEVFNLAGGAPSDQTLVSAGVGMRAALPAGFAVNLEVARPINEPLQRTQSDKWRIFFSASKQF